MPRTDLPSSDQDRRIEELGLEYPDGLRVTPGGPAHDRRVTVACPDGRTIVLSEDGTTFADSKLARPPRGFDPKCDVVLVQTSLDHDDWFVVPPTRWPGAGGEHLFRDDALELAEEVRVWRGHVTGSGDTSVWEVRAGSAELVGPFDRTPDGWERS